MNIKEDTKAANANVGVIMARFQVPYLTEAHKDLINRVISKHAKQLIVLGAAPILGSINDPLTVPPRRQMILESFPHKEFPNLTVLYVKDNPSDEYWSKDLDKVIQNELSPNDKAVLYGGRDSFITHYKGSFPVVELEQTRSDSGTEICKKVAAAPQSNPDFRMGVIWGSQQRYPVAYSTVDILVYDPKENRVLFGRKPDATAWRLIGGFVDPTDDSFETAALRELVEEAGFTVGLDGLRYIGSQKIDDWRYRNNPSEKIITHLYVGFYYHGGIKAGSDLAEVGWFDYDRIASGKQFHDFSLTKEHEKLWEKCKTYINEYKAAKNK
jgi:bifunctional NMN adenylyltransferase/nudix hydrolase